MLFFNGEFEVVLVDLPNIFILAFEINFVSIDEDHFIVVPELDEGGLHDTLANYYIIAVLVVAHGAGDPFDCALLVEYYYVVGIYVAGGTADGFAYFYVEYVFEHFYYYREVVVAVGCFCEGLGWEGNNCGEYLGQYIGVGILTLLNRIGFLTFDESYNNFNRQNKMSSSLPRIKTVQELGKHQSQHNPPPLKFRKLTLDPAENG